MIISRHHSEKTKLKMALKHVRKITHEVDTNGCWICTSHRVNNSGYAMIRTNTKRVPIHRLMFEQKYGKIPEGFLACHKCDVRNCINPDHIFIGTNDDNMTDMAIKGRAAHGENHPLRKLTNDQVLEIRKDNRTYSEIGHDYGVTYSCIYMIKNNRNWKHLKVE